jgi:uncharacterized protein (DUF1778 family)
MLRTEVATMTKALKTKEERIELRVRSQDKRLLEKAARAQGLSLSSYLVTRSLHAAKEDAIPVKTYILSKRDVDLFLRLLETPPAPNDKLKAAARRYQKEMS